MSSYPRLRAHADHAALIAVSEELKALADSCDALQTAVVDLMWRAGPEAAAAHPELQNLDYMSQALSAVSVFTARIAAGDTRVGAALGLGLSDLEGRLNGQAPQARDGVPGVGGDFGRGGVCVLFSD